MAYKITIEPLAKWDIQQGIYYYNEKQKGLGKLFHTEVKHYIETIKQNPFYQVRYDNIHCLPLKKFPVMIHYNINEKAKTVVIRAIINTSLNPNESWIK